MRRLQTYGHLQIHQNQVIAVRVEEHEVDRLFSVWRRLALVAEFGHDFAHQLSHHCAVLYHQHLQVQRGVGFDAAMQLGLQLVNGCRFAFART